MNFNEELKQRVEQINALLAAKLPAEEGMQQRVAEAMNYSVNAGGKRLRPMLLLEVYRLLGGTASRLVAKRVLALKRKKPEKPSRLSALTARPLAAHLTMLSA